MTTIHTAVIGYPVVEYP